MASSEFHIPDRSDPPSSTGPPSTAPQPPPPDRAPDQGLLEAILRETLPETDDAAPLEPAEREGLLDVARRHAGRELVLDPVAVELVQAVLRPSVPVSWTGSDLWQWMTLEVATTVFEDPQFRKRLDSLWNGLRAGLP